MVPRTLGMSVSSARYHNHRCRIQNSLYKTSTFGRSTYRPPNRDHRVHITTKFAFHTSLPFRHPSPSPPARDDIPQLVCVEKQMLGCSDHYPSNSSKTIMEPSAPMSGSFALKIYSAQRERERGTSLAISFRNSAQRLREHSSVTQRNEHSLIPVLFTGDLYWRQRYGQPL